MSQKITIDGDTLRRSASDLTRIADGLADSSQRISATTISSNAFGMMNSWMVGSITAVSDRSTQLVSASGKVTAAVGTAAASSADDFEELEQAIVTSVSGFLSQLGTA